MSDHEDLFEMANLSPALTGLPMVIWVSERGHPAGQARGLKAHRHDVRIKVNTTHGRRMAIDTAATVAVRPTPRLIAGSLSPDDMWAVGVWVIRNEAALVAYWEGRLLTDELIQRLQPLSPPIPP